MIDGKKTFFWYGAQNDSRTYDNINKIPFSQVDDYKTGCLLDHKYFKNYYGLITKELSKQHVLHAEPGAIQQISFTENLD